MVSPIDYRLNVKSPFERIIGNMQVGSNIAEMQLKREEEARKVQAAAVMQEDFNVLASNPAAGAKEYSEMMVKYPQLSEHLKRGFDVMSEDKRSGATQHATQVYAALNAGKPEIAQEIIAERTTALRNSGREDEARSTELMGKLIQANPDSARASAGLLLSSMLGPDKFSASVTALGEEGRKSAVFDPERVKKIEDVDLQKKAADLGLTNAQKNKAIIEGRKISAETAKTLMEIESLKKTGGVEPAKIFEQEEKLRKEYQARIGNFTAMKQHQATIDASAADGSGAGDIALVTSFMKMLDPGSVVRETEFANARDTAGLLSRLQNQAQKLQTGSFLDPKQRDDFKRLAGQYMAAAEKQQGATKASLGKVVKNYGLNSENVFGVEEKPAVPPAPGATAAPASGVNTKTLELLDKYLPKGQP